MGNSESESFETRFYNKYAFNQLFDDPNFGQIKVYRKKELNYDYVMVLQKYVPQSSLKELVNEITALHQSFLRPDQPMALRIFNYQVLQDKWSQCKLPMVRLYVQYFNFTLHDLIQKYQEKSYVFNFEQIMYILYAAIHTFDFFSRFSNSAMPVNSKCIYLSPEGCIKFSPVKTQQFFQDPDAFCKAIWYETRQRALTTNQDKKEKQFINQVRKLMGEILKLYIRNDPNSRTAAFINQVRKKNNLPNLRKIVSKPTVDCLMISKKEGSTTQSIDSRNIIGKPYSVDNIYYGSSEHSSKMSVKNIRKTYHRS